MTDLSDLVVVQCRADRNKGNKGHIYFLSVLRESFYFLLAHAPHLSLRDINGSALTQPSVSPSLYFLPTIHPALTTRRAPAQENVFRLPPSSFPVQQALHKRVRHRGDDGMLAVNPSRPPSAILARFGICCPRVKCHV